ncbi:DUF1127 domain-containing protein [Agrobacterium pusense]|uniref:DUF1127 domain-containing protein n=1 Tax=Agrobacterium pusense TaxID=648995 RepID=UPI00289C9CB4|nr:DUF1127 domain-containing protein [Agrobacterium pusense]
MSTTDIVKDSGPALPAAAPGRQAPPKSARSIEAASDITSTPDRWGSLIRLVLLIVVAVDRRLEKYKQIRDLRELTDEQLEDIGLSKRDVEQASPGAFWDFKKPYP